MNNNLKNGFTLIELLITIAIVGIIISAITSLFTTSNEVYISQDQIVRLQQDVRATLDMMTKNIRMSGLDPTNADCAGFVEPTNSTAISMRMDYDSDGNCSDGNPEQSLSYIYDAQGNEILEDSEMMSQDIVALSLLYWFNDGTNSTDPNGGDLNDIRKIDIVICGRISGPYAEKYDTNHCLESSVRPRNLGI